MRKVALIVGLLCAPVVAKAQACPSGSYTTWLSAGWCTVGDASLRLNATTFAYRPYAVTINAIRSGDVLDLTVSGYLSSLLGSGLARTVFDFSLSAPRAVRSIQVQRVDLSGKPIICPLARESDCSFDGWIASHVEATICGTLPPSGDCSAVIAGVRANGYDQGAPNFTTARIDGDAANRLPFSSPVVPVPSGNLSTFRADYLVSNDEQAYFFPDGRQVEGVTVLDLQSVTYRIAFVPEPSTYLLCAMSLGAIIVLARRRRATAEA